MQGRRFVQRRFFEHEIFDEKYCLKLHQNIIIWGFQTANIEFEG
jgi:hypothetical protein